MTAAAHSSSSISVQVGLTLFLEVGSRGLGGGERKRTLLGRNTSLLHLCSRTHRIPWTFQMFLSGNSSNHCIG